MKGIGIGSAGGRALSRMQGTKVTLAGRTAFLPNDDVPFVMQKLTMGQINAIPKGDARQHEGIYDLSPVDGHFRTDDIQ